jgi:hypothetical protein
VNKMAQEETNFEKTLAELIKLKELAKDKIKELMENGILTASMLEFDFDEGEEEIEVKYTILYPDGNKEDITKSYSVEITFNVRET